MVLLQNIKDNPDLSNKLFAKDGNSVSQTPLPELEFSDASASVKVLIDVIDQSIKDNPDLFNKLFGKDGDSIPQTPLPEVEFLDASASAKFLIEAIKNNDLESVKNWTQRGADVNTTAWGETPLRHAVILGNLDMVEFLLNSKAHLNTSEERYKGRWGNELMLAAQHGHMEVLKLLLERGAKPNVTNDYGDSALSYAVQNGDIEMVNLLIEKVTSKELNHERFVASVLTYAIWRNEDPNASERLRAFQSNSKYEVLKLLLDKHFNVNAKGSCDTTVLLALCSMDFNKRTDLLDLLNLLLTHNADINVKDAYGDTPIGLAKKNKNHKLLKVLKDTRRKNRFYQFKKWLRAMLGLNHTEIQP